MNVDNMRWIDRRIGVPLTLLLSLLIWIKNKILFVKRQSPDVARTLFIELSEMGSAIIVDPAMRKLQREGSSELFFTIFKDNFKSLKFLNTIPESNIFTLRSNNLFVMALDVIRFMRWCRKKKVTAVIDLELFSRFTAILCGLSGAPARIGFVSFHDEGLYRGSIINFPVRYNPHVHISVNFMSLVQRALKYFTNPYATVEVKKDDLILAKATISDAEKETVKNKVKDLYPEWNGEELVLINANASELLPQRRWQPENFARVSKMILKSWNDVLLIATGSPDERDYVQNVVDQANSSRFVNSAGVFEFEELVPLYSISKLMLTNDSGPAHFAAVTDLKVFVLFGPESPTLYMPMGNAEAIYLGLPCSPCVSAANHRKTTCETRECIAGIRPEMVYGKISNYLNS